MYVEIVDRDGKSSLLSLVKAFDSVLAVYEGFCNLKQVGVSACFLFFCSLILFPRVFICFFSYSASVLCLVAEKTERMKTNGILSFFVCCHGFFKMNKLN